MDRSGAEKLIQASIFLRQGWSLDIKRLPVINILGFELKKQIKINKVEDDNGQI